MPKFVNGKINVGLIMSKETGQQKLSGEQLCDIFNNQFKRSNYNFATGWDNVGDLGNYLKTDGVSTVNELSEIIVMDDGFIQNVESIPMCNNFISLQEIMTYRGVKSPKLILATGKQGLYDLFKKDTSPEGHALFSYDKAQVVKLNVDRNGDFNLSDLNRVLNGTFRNVLSIKNVYHGREEAAQQHIKDLKKSKMNNTADITDQIKAQIKARDEKRKQEYLAKKNFDPAKAARERIIKNRQKVKETFKSSSNNSNQNKPNLSYSEQAMQQINQNNNNNQQLSSKKIDQNYISNTNLNDLPKYDPNKKQSERLNSQETGISVNRQHQHNEQSYYNNVNDNEQDEFNKIRIHFHEIAKQVKQRSNLNFDSKIYNDTGKILFGGLSGSGISSVIANLAQYYALMNKKVLIINISNDDHITRYFHDFIPKYRKLGRKNSLSTRFARSLSEISVPVKPNLELISDYGLIQKDMTLEKKLENYSRIIRFSDEYDIVLINGGTNFEQVLLNTSTRFLDDTVIITTQDDLDEIPLDLIHQPFKFSMKLKNLKHPIGIIVNKIQYRVSKDSLNQSILNLPLPLDSSRLIGEISYQPDWYLQRISGVLSVAYNNTQKIIFHEFAKKIILRDVI